MTKMSTWVEAVVKEHREWSDGLRTLILEGPRLQFEPGQFVNLALDTPEGRIKRAYSLASAVGEAPEFYLARVDDGQLTPLLFDLPPGRELWLDTAVQGFFTLSWLPESARDLWLIATGTGLGPFVSMWRTPGALERFEHVVVVHCARAQSQLAYRQELTRLCESDTRLHYVPMVTREAPEEGVVPGRIPLALGDGRLERAAGVQLDPARSHLMLCGNPAMIKDVTRVLGERGYRKHRRREPGHISVEKYW